MEYPFIEVGIIEILLGILYIRIQMLSLMHKIHIYHPFIFGFYFAPVLTFKIILN